MTDSHSNRGIRKGAGQSAADAFGASLTAFLLTGANQDGAAGLKAVAEAGGMVAVEDPASAFAPAMPEAGLKAWPSAMALNLDALASVLLRVGSR